MRRVLNVLPAELSFSATDADKVQGVMEILNSVVPMNKVTLNRESAEGVEPKVFLYKLDAADGRVWRQHITFVNGADPLMTFDVADQWRLSEFSNQRSVRNALVSLVLTYPTLEKITYDFQPA